MGHDIVQAFAQYRLLTGTFLAAVVLTVFVWVKAVRAARKRNAQREALLEKLRHEEQLRQKYAALTPSLAENAEMPELLHGVALCIQKQLEDAPDMDAAFVALASVPQHIYALDFVFCEDAESLSGFFRLNGKALTTVALDGARASFPPDALSLFEKGFAMFDDADETVSCLPADVEALDSAFASLDRTALYAAIRRYIAAHAAEFK